jgi:hypothetical protein
LTAEAFDNPMKAHALQRHRLLRAAFTAVRGQDSARLHAPMLHTCFTPLTYRGLHLMHLKHLVSSFSSRTALVSLHPIAHILSAEFLHEA